MKRVAAIQSSYIPWRGFFDIIASVDEFILLDEVQYTRRDWRNRNRIKTEAGAKWLTIPVQAKGRYHQRIDEVRIADPSWAQRHWRTLEQAYRRAAHFGHCAKRLARAYETAGRLESLSEINALFLTEICAMLEIGTPLVRSTRYRSAGTKTERLVSLCVAAGADEYLSGPSARDYIEPELFAEHGMSLKFMSYEGYPEYPQLHPPFEPTVSVLDLLFNTGPEARRFLERTELSENPRAGAVG